MNRGMGVSLPLSTPFPLNGGFVRALEAVRVSPGSYTTFVDVNPPRASQPPSLSGGAGFLSAELARNDLILDSSSEGHVLVGSSMRPIRYRLASRCHAVSVAEAGLSRRRVWLLSQPHTLGMI